MGGHSLGGGGSRSGQQEHPDRSSRSTQPAIPRPNPQAPLLDRSVSGSASQSTGAKTSSIDTRDVQITTLLSAVKDQITIIRGKMRLDHRKNSTDTFLIDAGDRAILLLGVQKQDFRNLCLSLKEEPDTNSSQEDQLKYSLGLLYRFVDEVNANQALSEQREYDPSSYARLSFLEQIKRIYVKPLCVLTLAGFTLLLNSFNGFAQIADGINSIKSSFNLPLPIINTTTAMIIWSAPAALISLIAASCGLVKVRNYVKTLRERNSTKNDELTQAFNSIKTILFQLRQDNPEKSSGDGLINLINEGNDTLFFNLQKLSQSRKWSKKLFTYTELSRDVVDYVLKNTAESVQKRVLSDGLGKYISAVDLLDTPEPGPNLCGVQLSMVCRDNPFFTELLIKIFEMKFVVHAHPDIVRIFNSITIEKNDSKPEVRSEHRGEEFFLPLKNAYNAMRLGGDIK
ncbi:hypothetical protein KKF81_05770 [Candidatus Micrarchaeota archaeon]|nr:hypothetical protein [Candidatus Micrarchaeota archaeon]